MGTNFIDTTLISGILGAVAALAAVYLAYYLLRRHHLDFSCPSHTGPSHTVTIDEDKAEIGWYTVWDLGGALFSTVAGCEDSQKSQETRLQLGLKGLGQYHRLPQSEEYNTSCRPAHLCLR